MRVPFKDTARKIRWEASFGPRSFWLYRGSIVTTAWQDLAHLIPRKLAYFAAVRVIAEATTGKWSNTNVVDLPAMEAVRRWDDEAA